MNSKLEWANLYQNELLNHVLPFWTRHGVDRQMGGFMTCLDQDGKILDTDKGVWQQARATWLFAELYNSLQPRNEWLQLAFDGARFIEQYCFDPGDGRMWFHVTRDGRPIRKRRYSYTESFAAIAFGELAKATGESRYADKARQLFLQFVNHDPNSTACGEKFTTTRPTISLGVPMITIVTAQELRDSIGMSDANEWIDNSINTIATRHLCSQHKCVLEVVSPDGTFIDHFDGRTLNPGHAIEAAWFILREGQIRSDATLIELGVKILEWSWKIGWDKEHGGILYFVDVLGQPVQEYWHDMKFWWPQCEAILATLFAWQTTGDTKYRDWHHQIHEWAFNHFPDSEHGEWFGYLHRDGRLSSRLKGNLWKGPFHVPRMMLTAWKMLSE